MLKLFLTFIFILIQTFAFEASLAQISPTSGDEDILKELKEQTKKEEESLKPDLESLGLDQLPEIEKVTTPTAPQPPVKTAPLPEIPSADLKAVDVKKKEEAKKPEKPSDPRFTGIISEQPIKEESKETEKEAEKPSEQKEENPATKDTNKKSLSDIISKPIDRIKNFIGSDKKSPKEQDEIKTESRESEDDKQKQQALELKKAKEQERREKIRLQRIAAQELRQKQKDEKLELLRQQYLNDESNEDVFEGLVDYKIISKIVPKEKVPPKFLSTDIPPPLLNRIKGDDNKHHPMIMTDSERLDFIFKAIANNNIEEFNALYAQIKDPNLKNNFGDTLLTFAILMQRPEAIASILSKGADPDMKNRLGYTPINIAIEMMDHRSVKTLVEMGADINYIDGSGRTYLMQASRVGSLPIVDLLISKGVNINAFDNNEVTALAFAYKYKRDIIAKYLLKYGAKNWIKKDDYLVDDTPMINDIFEKWGQQ